MTNKGKSVSIHPQSFVDEALCDLCFEDALKIGQAKSERLRPQDFKETSIRFCVDGLYKWYKSYSKRYGKGSVFTMIRDTSWWWASFCEANATLSSAVREYYDLLGYITENTDYTDLAEKMDEAGRIEKVGKNKMHFTVVVPFETHGVISDCAVSLGIPFSQFFQVGLGRAISANRLGLYETWSKSKIQPLFDEVMGRADQRLKSFREIKNDVAFRSKDE